MRLRSSRLARWKENEALRRLACAGIAFLAGCGSSSGGDGSPAQVAPAGGGNSTLRGHVAFSVIASTASNGIYMAPLDGSSPAHRVTPMGTNAFHPRFSRDGSSVYYVSVPSPGVPEIRPRFSAAGNGDPSFSYQSISSPVVDEVRNIAVDGTNDHLVYACGAETACFGLGEDQTGRVFVWSRTSSQTAFEGVLGTLGAANGGAATFVPWSADPGCTLAANLDTAGDTIAMLTNCASPPPPGIAGDPHVFVGGVTAAGPLMGHSFSGVEVITGVEHIQYAAGRVFVEGVLPGSNVNSLYMHVKSMAPDGSDVQDVDVGDDAADFVVSNDARFVLVSHQTDSPSAGASTYSILAHVGSTRTSIPGLGAISSLAAVTLAWTPH
jgi:hypothetical protein